MSRWTKDIPLEEQIARVLARADERSEGCEFPSGASETDLLRAEKRLGCELPAELRELYRMMSPDTWDAAHDPEQMGLLLLSLDELFVGTPASLKGDEWAGIVDWHETLRAWNNSHLLRFAQEPGSSDYLCVCTDPPPGIDGVPHRPGMLVWIERDLTPIRIMTLTLGQWLARYIDCGMFEPASYPGNPIYAPFQTQLDYFEHHVQLNPRDDWGKERRAKLRIVRNPPIVEEVHHYHAASGEMRPLSQCTDLEELVLTQDQARTLKPLRTLVNLKVLWVYIGDDPDLTPLRSLERLEGLDLRGDNLDLQSLGSLQSLRRLNLDGCGVRSFAPLATCASLRLLQINRATCPDWESISLLTQLEIIHADGMTSATSLAPLLALSNLKHLSCRGVQFPKAEVDALRRRHPGAKIYVGGKA